MWDEKAKLRRKNSSKQICFTLFCFLPLQYDFRFVVRQQEVPYSWKQLWPAVQDHEKGKQRPRGPSSHITLRENRQPSFLLTWGKIYHKAWLHSICKWEAGSFICKAASPPVLGENQTVCDMRKNEGTDQDHPELKWESSGPGPLALWKPQHLLECCLEMKVQSPAPGWPTGRSVPC